MDAIEKVGEELKLKIFPKQRAFIESDLDDVLYGGAAGGGKSYALLLFALKRRMEIPQSKGIVFRRTYPELQRSLIEESRKIFPLVGAKYNEQKHTWRFPNGSLQEFGHCEREADVYNYQGAEYQDIGFDEQTHFTQFQFTYLTSRCRTAIPNTKALIRGATNPGGVGHMWVRDRYVTPFYLHKIWKDKETGKTFTFIPATIEDNPALFEQDPMYKKRLRDLGEKKYMALAFGRWDVFEGQFFDNWDPRPGFGVLMKPRKPDTFTVKFLSLDWGYADPACALWFEVTPMGRVFVYKELYVTQRGPKELAHDILNACPEEEEYQFMMASPEIWGKKADMDGGGETIQQSMQLVFGDRIPMQKANNARIPGWNKTREYLNKAPDGYPWLQVSPSVTNLIRTLPMMVYNDSESKNGEDMNSDAEDHACESLRYGLVSLNTIQHPSLNPFGDPDYHRIFGRSEEPTRFEAIPQGRSGYGF